MLKVENLQFAYPGEEALRFPDFALKNDEHLLVLGQSGSGKTTLLHLMAGLLTGYNGSIKIKNTELSSLKSAALDRFRGSEIGVIFQVPHFVQSVSVLENLLLAQSLPGNKTSKEHCEAILDQLSLGHLAHKHPSQLSEGEKQRVSIARAVVNTPEIIFADEPTSALDDRNCDKVFELLDKTAERLKANLVIVTHDGRLKDKFDRKIELSR